MNQYEVLLDMEQVFADMQSHLLPPSSRSPLLTRLPPLAALRDLFRVLSATTSSIILILLPPLFSQSVNHTLTLPSLFSIRLLLDFSLQQLHFSLETLQTPANSVSPLSTFKKKKKTENKKTIVISASKAL